MLVILVLEKDKRLDGFSKSQSSMVGPYNAVLSTLQLIKLIYTNISHLCTFSIGAYTVVSTQKEEKKTTHENRA